MADDRYDNRYCAYVDILGFRELVGKLASAPGQFDALRKLLERIHSPKGEALEVYTDADFRAQSISDAVAISTAANPHGLALMVYSLEQLTLDLLYEGFLIRGAIVKGSLYHDDKMVFGEALVRHSA